MHKTRLKAAGVFFCLTVAFGIGLYIGIANHFSTAEAQSTGTASINISLGTASQPSGVDMQQFWQAWNLLQHNYIPTHSSTTPTDQEKVFGAIKGLTDSYGDPYTVFMPPADAQVFQDDISGQFSGVGMEMDTDAKGNLVVVAPLKDSPAQKAGVRTGDLIIGINGSSTQGLAVDQAVKLIRGPKGTTVKLQIMRGTQQLEIPVMRDTIQIPEINTTARSDGTFVIQLYTFSANSADLFRNALRDFFQTGDTKLVLDLRGNPGGYLEAAVDMASYFLPVGDVVVTEDFKGKQDNVSHRSLGYNVFVNKKLSMVILVDKGSASASEILAGALQQHGVAKLVGTRTFGKGSVQQLMDLGGGAQLKITIARWLTPNGTSISDGGLTPDIKADRTADDVKATRDPQMDAAVLWLTSQ